MHTRFNVLSLSSNCTGEITLNVLMSLIAYAGAVGLVALLEGYFEILDELVVKWQLDRVSRRKLFLAVYNALEDQNCVLRSQRYLIKYLATLEAEDLSDHRAKELSAKAVAIAVRKPIVYFQERHNLIGLVAVNSLKGDSADGKLYELLEIFTSGKLKDYVEFAKKNQDVLKQHSIEHKECVHYMRLLSMCSLATEQQEIPYEKIAEDLDVPLDNVEDWVVVRIPVFCMTPCNY